MAVCHFVQSQEQTLLLEPSNAYRRAIQYQQLEKLHKHGSGEQGFYVQVRQSHLILLLVHDLCIVFDQGLNQMLACANRPPVLVSSGCN